MWIVYLHSKVYNVVDILETAHMVPACTVCDIKSFCDQLLIKQQAIHTMKNKIMINVLQQSTN